MRDSRLFLQDVLDAMESVEMFVQGMTLEEFQADDKTTSAVIRKFEIMGEASSLAPCGRPQGILDSRLFSGGLSVGRSTIHERIPQIKPHLRRILEEEG